MKKIQENRIKMKIRTGDTVRVLRGRDRGKRGKIMAAFPGERRVLIEGLNMIFRHVRPKRAGEKGQRVQVAAPISVSNIQLVCPACSKGTRVGMRLEGETRVRFCKQCEEAIS